MLTGSVVSWNEGREPELGIKDGEVNMSCGGEAYWGASSPVEAK